MSLPPPCHFFAQGNCRFGNNCHFYHDQAKGGAVNTTGRRFGNRTLVSDTFKLQQQKRALNRTPDVIVEKVKKDMQKWQNSGIWPYSCYAPIGGKPCIPGFEDLSPEEYRYNYMLSRDNLQTSISVYLQQIRQLRLNYQQYSQENRIMIEKIVTATTSGVRQTEQKISTIFSGSGQQINIFGGAPPQSTTIIGVGTTGSGGLFRNQQQNTCTIFGGASSTFGADQITGTASNVFEQTVTASDGGTATTSPFQTQQPNLSIFGSPSAFSIVPSGEALLQQPQQQQNILPSNPPQQLPSFFQQPLVLPGPESGALEQQPPTGGDLFQQQSSQQSENIFEGGSNQQPPFKTISLAIPRIFGGSTGNSPLLRRALNIKFHQPPSQQPCLMQKGTYTPEADLKPEELIAYQASEFTVENLPTVPPSQDLCR